MSNDMKETDPNGREDGRIERRQVDRSADTADWESKVLARVRGRVRDLTKDPDPEVRSGGGWESSVLDTLRRRIERDPS